jgi:uncharacterized protein YbjT (DUF2867 family)
MILVTGATGFVGRRLVYRLCNDAHVQVRVLMRPGSDASRLPRPVTVHTMIGNITDKDSLLAAMDGIHTIFHLVGTETRGRHSQLDAIDLAGSMALIDAALTARVGRIVYVSRIGAERASAFPLLRVKGEIEEALRTSGLAYTIYRPGVLFGAGDRFSENIGMICAASPLYTVPGDGETIFQPLWVEDLVSCLVMGLEEFDLIDSVVSMGGPELLSYRRLVMRVMHTIASSRPIMGLPLLVNRTGSWFLDGLFARWPINEYWMEMCSTSQTSELGVIERQFGFRPASFDVPVLSTYMRGKHYSLRFLKYIFTRTW